MDFHIADDLPALGYQIIDLFLGDDSVVGTEITNDDSMSLIFEFLYDVVPDEAEAACYQNIHKLHCTSLI